MKDSSKTAERVLLLYILLSQGMYTRDEIFEQIPLYRETRTGRNAALNRDLSVIEKVGIPLQREQVPIAVPPGTVIDPFTYEWQPGERMAWCGRYSIKKGDEAAE